MYKNEIYSLYKHRGLIFMKKLYLYLIKNTKKINFICLLCCIIPIIAGICLWIWLPDKLIC